MIPQFKDVEDPKFKESLLRNSKSILSAALDNDRELYNTISTIKTVISSLELQANGLIKQLEEFKKQKI